MREHSNFKYNGFWWNVFEIQNIGRRVDRVNIPNYWKIHAKFDKVWTKAIILVKRPFWNVSVFTDHWLYSMCQISSWPNKFVG